MLFVTNYVQGTLTGKISAAEAARKAGYANDRARQTAHELLNPNMNPFVVEAVNEMKQDLYETAGVSMASHLSSLKEIREAAMENKHYSAAVNAEVNRGRVAGFYDNKAQAENSLDSLSKEELIKVLENYDKLGISQERGLIVHDDMNSEPRNADGD